MDEVVISLKDKVQVAERGPEDLNHKVVEELISLVQKVERQEEAKDQSKVQSWFYRAPFPGVKYYCFE